MRRNWLLWCFLLLVMTRVALADGGPAFDLEGPRIDAKVTRNGKTLPIGSVAALAPGDRVWVHPDFPENPGARYVLVVAFLRGSVDPPPENWFTKAETWNKKIRQEGLYVTVPEGAQQALLFLAPETGGDFSTVRNAVRGRPGAFVRASQDLHQASLDGASLDTYLAAVKTADSGDPKAVEEQTKLLARSLNIKVDAQCFDKPTEQQAPCLVQNPDSLVLDRAPAVVEHQAVRLLHQARRLLSVGLSKHCASTLIFRLRAGRLVCSSTALGSPLSTVFTAARSVSAAPDPGSPGADLPKRARKLPAGHAPHRAPC